LSEVDTVIALCNTCNTPLRVDFAEGTDEIVAVYAVCGHIKWEPTKEEAHDG
jgi:hypothetical protein